MNRINKIGKTELKDNYIIKEDKDNIDTFNYLESRDFKNFIKYDNRLGNKSYYKYIESNNNNNNKGDELAIILSLLHNKTSYSTELRKDKIIDIKNNIINYTNYLEDYYKELISKIEIKKYPSPSELILLCNFSKLSSIYIFIKEEIINWYDNFINNKKERLCLNHGNLNLDHLIGNKEKYLISWDKSSFDTPIKDLSELYKKEWDKIEFNSFFSHYLNKCKLNSDEKRLLFITISIPNKIEFNENELVNVKNITNLFNYISKTEELVRSYYPKKDEE